MREQIDKIELLIKSFNWHSPSWDLFIILFWLGASVLYAFAAGRGRVIAMLMSIYAAKLFVLEIPFLRDFASKNLPPHLVNYTHLIVFLAIFAVLFLFLSRYTFHTAADKRHMSGFAYSLGFSIFQVGLFINTILTVLPKEVTDKLSELVQYLFIQPAATIFWLAAPVVFLLVLGKFIADRADP